MSAYETAKKYLWPHTLVPLALIVSLDYVAIVGALVQVFAVAYLMLQLIAFVLGFAAAGILHFSPTSPWGAVFRYNVVRFFPLMQGGQLAFDYLMAEVDSERRALGEVHGSADDAKPAMGAAGKTDLEV